jgi:hypothetical protein
MTALKPCRKPGITSRTIGRETILSSGTDAGIHILNPTAKLIWDLCDGQHTLAEIEQAMRVSFAIPAHQSITEDIRQTLDELQRKGLLESEAGRR